MLQKYFTVTEILFQKLDLTKPKNVVLIGLLMNIPHLTLLIDLT